MFSPVRTLLFLGLFLARHGSAQLEMPHGEDSQQYVVKCKYQALACPRETAFQSVDNQSTLGFILVRPKGEDNIVTTFFLEENVTLKGSTRDYEPDQQGIALRAERELTQGTPDLRKCCRIVFFAGMRPSVVQHKLGRVTTFAHLMCMSDFEGCSEDMLKRHDLEHGQELPCWVHEMECLDFSS